MNKRSFWTAACGLAATLFTSTASAQTVSIPVIGDKWDYPFAVGGTGFRDEIPIFGAEQPVNLPMLGLSDGELNYHDSTFLIEFGPSALVPSTDYQSGNTPASYNFSSAKVILTNVEPTDGSTPWAWDLDNDFGVDDNGSSIPLYLNIHGVGFISGDSTTWDETQSYDGPCNGMFPCPPGTVAYKPRNPFPINLDDMATSISAENTAMPPSWATSVSTPGYTPGVTDTKFTVEFDLDVADPDVKTYIQEGLASGSLIFNIISNANSSGGTGGAGAVNSLFPRFAANPSVPGSNPDAAVLVFENFTDGSTNVESWDQFD